MEQVGTHKQNKQGMKKLRKTNTIKDLCISKMVRFSIRKPPFNEEVIFIWWHRNGLETSQKTLGFMDSQNLLHLDFKPAGGKPPDFWCFFNKTDDINLRELFDEFYEWLDGLSQPEYDNMSLTDKCEKFFFKT